MTNTIKCKKCGAEIEVTQAFQHQIEEQIRSRLGEDHAKEMESLKKETEEKVKKKVAEELQLQIKDAENEKKELRIKNQELGNQLLDLNKLIRELKTKDEQRQLEMEKKLNEVAEKMKEDLAKRYTQEYRLKELEKDKKIHDMELLVEELKRKAQQGSMQTQGEVMELDLESFLHEAFPHDEITPVEKGVTGADVRQIVKTSLGTECGVILWESKRTKAWSDEWLSKLKKDLRAETANIPVIITQTMPKEIKEGFGFKDGVWVTNTALVLPVALLLRKNLIDVMRQKVNAVNRGEKSEQLFSYVTSHEFQQQIEALVEVYKEMQEQVMRERIAYEKSWKQREAQIKKLFVSTAGVYGNMQGIIGSSLPQVKGFELLELEDGKEE